MALEDYAYEIGKCSGGHYCKFVPWQAMKGKRFSYACPSIAYSTFHAYSAGGRMAVAQSMLEGRVTSYTPEMLKVIFECQLCGACEVCCRPHNWYLSDLMAILEEMRFRAVEDGAGPLPGHAELAGRVEAGRNAYGADNSRRFAWMPESVEPAPQADILYWAGCATAFRRPDIARATTKVLARLGLNFMVLGEDEWCCGTPLWKAGLKDRAAAVMRHNAKAIAESGARRLLVGCGECYASFKTDYVKAGCALTVEVVSFAELMAERVERGELEMVNEVPLRVTYHDPCNLGRNSEPYEQWNGEWKRLGPHLYGPKPEKQVRMGAGGCYEPPRRVLSAIPGIELVEMPRNRSYAWCCGGGVECSEAFPEFTAFTAAERVEEAVCTGARALVSHCPHCSENFGAALKEADGGMEYYDLAELVARAMGV